MKTIDELEAGILDWDELPEIVDALAAENAKLKDALRPFAREGEHLLKASQEGRFISLGASHSEWITAYRILKESE